MDEIELFEYCRCLGFKWNTSAYLKQLDSL